MCDRVEALLAELDRPEHAARLVRERLARGDPLVGFGHPLYPGGDPRTRVLLDDAARLAPRSPTVRKALALREVVSLAGAGAPTVDYGLVAVAAASGFPTGHAVTVFAIGRMAGWIAHVGEQRTAGALLRPRARYVGERRLSSDTVEF
jgi:citrate synthase